MKRIILAFFLAFLASEAWATCSAVPFSFTAGTTAQSGQVNADFAALVSCINAIDAGQITSGTLAAAVGGTGHGTWTGGSVIFAASASVLSQDNANFFWDSTNHRLGLATASPSFLLDVNGTANASNWEIAGNNAGGSGTVGFANANGPGIQFWGTASANTGNMIFTASGLVAMTLTPTIRLGVGVASPGFTIDSAGDINAAGIFRVAGTAGVTCNGSPTSSFASINGIVTHC